MLLHTINLCVTGWNCLIGKKCNVKLLYMQTKHILTRVNVIYTLKFTLNNDIPSTGSIDYNNIQSRKYDYHNITYIILTI